MFLAVCQVCQANFLPVNLKVNGLSNPVGIDTSNPTFSWQTESDERGFLQSAYELVVRSASGAEVWKSGKVESALQNQITYAGSPLVSCSPYSWTVTVYDKNGKASVASKGTSKLLSSMPMSGKRNGYNLPKPAMQRWKFRSRLHAGMSNLMSPSWDFLLPQIPSSISYSWQKWKSIAEKKMWPVRLPSVRAIPGRLVTGT